MSNALNSQEISFEQCCELMEQSSISNTLDLGVVLIHDAEHGDLGHIQIVNTTSGRSALIRHA